MNQVDLKQAVIALNNAFSTNNPKGLTDALKNAGYPVDSRFDILNNDALNKALLELYLTDPNKWGQVMSSVKFNYQKTDSSTSPATKATFQNIAMALAPANAKLELPDWANTVLGLVLGETTTYHPGSSPSVIKGAAIWWGYVALSVIGLAIVLVVFFALRTKNI